jgi:hypothetical protein
LISLLQLSRSIRAIRQLLGDICGHPLPIAALGANIVQRWSTAAGADEQIQTNML